MARLFVQTQMLLDTTSKQKQNKRRALKYKVFVRSSGILRGEKNSRVLLRLESSKAAETLVVLGPEDLKGNKNNISSGRQKRKRKGNGNSLFRLSQMLPMYACALE